MQVNYTFDYANKTFDDAAVPIRDLSQMARVVLIEASHDLVSNWALLPRQGHFFCNSGVRSRWGDGCWCRSKAFYWKYAWASEATDFTASFQRGPIFRRIEMPVNAGPNRRGKHQISTPPSSRDAVVSGPHSE